MRLFIHEFFCSGAYAGELRESSLAREGLAMLAAVVEDSARLPDRRVVTTLDCRLNGHAAAARIAASAEIRWARAPRHERSLFRNLAATTDATFVIAPETGDCLAQRRQLVDSAGGHFLGHALDAIRLCADKLRFFEHMARHRLPTIPTALWADSTEELPFRFPVVIKPRDGAGSNDVYLIRNRSSFDSLRPTLASAFGTGKSDAIVQPFVHGQHLSVSAIVDSETSREEVFPIGEQRQTNDGRFRYQGGLIPARLRSTEIAVGIRDLVTAACHSIRGLAGYIGFDLLLPAQSAEALIIEANPRLTTSYLGYRTIAQENLALRLIQPGAAQHRIAWAQAEVGFDADGAAQLIEFPNGTAFGQAPPADMPSTVDSCRKTNGGRPRLAHGD